MKNNKRYGYCFSFYLYDGTEYLYDISFRLRKFILRELFNDFYDYKCRKILLPIEKLSNGYYSGGWMYKGMNTSGEPRPFIKCYLICG